MRDLVLSIIIPVYNVEKFLDRCMHSLLSQKLDDCEIILVNDGSTDNSGQICHNYEEIYKFIHVIDKTNGGLASARNAGLDVAQGKYISFLDSDDWLRGDSYNILIEIVKQYEPDVIGFGSNKTTDTKIYKQQCQRWKEGLHSGTEMQEIYEDIITGKEVFEFNVIRSSCMHIFKKELLDRLSLRFISEKVVLNEDYLFVTTAILNAKNYYCCKKFLYFYYTRENSLSKRYLTKMFERKQNLMKEYYKLALGMSFSDEQNYRLEIFYINNCYECLANEYSVKKPDFSRIKMVLKDKRLQGYIKNVRLDEQRLKAVLFITLIKIKSEVLYLIVYRIFSIIKSLRLWFKN